MFALRNQKLKLFFAFMLGATITAVLFSAAWLEVGRCMAGNPRCGANHRLGKVLAVFGAESPTTPSSPSFTGTATPAGAVGTWSGAKTSGARVYREESRTAITTMTFPTAQTPAGAKVFKKRRPNPSSSQNPPESSSFSIPKLKFGQRTHPIPESPYHDTSMHKRLNRRCPQTDFCRENLSPKEDEQYSKCISRCEGRRDKFGSVKNGSCRFLDGQGRLPVALASFPGSGNTWTRGLLEKVTGICTGSLYCDCALRVGGFTGEGVQGPSVLAMKTHNLKVQFVGGHVFSNTRVPYGAAVLLVRDPRRALVAEWNRERSKRMTSPNVSNHFTYVGEEYFGDNQMWERYIHLKLPRWSHQMVNLLQEAKMATRPVYILVFEDLKADTVGEMKKVTDFLGFSFTEREVAERLAAGFSKFYRNHTSEFNHFTPAQESYISDVVRVTSQFMRDNSIHDMFPRIDEYI